MFSISTVVKLSKAAMAGTRVFIEHESANGWTDIVYGCVASVNLNDDTLMIRFGENSIMATRSDDIWFSTFENVNLTIDAGERFEFHLDAREMQRHMVDHKLQFLMTSGNIEPWIENKNTTMKANIRASFVR